MITRDLLETEIAIINISEGGKRLLFWSCDETATAARFLYRSGIKTAAKDVASFFEEIFQVLHASKSIDSGFESLWMNRMLRSLPTALILSEEFDKLDAHLFDFNFIRLAYAFYVFFKNGLIIRLMNNLFAIWKQLSRK
jgi:hypothetical protein